MCIRAGATYLEFAVQVLRSTAWTCARLLLMSEDSSRAMNARMVLVSWGAGMACTGTGTSSTADTLQALWSVDTEGLGFTRTLRVAAVAGAGIAWAAQVRGAELFLVYLQRLC